MRWKNKIIFFIIFAGILWEIWYPFGPRIANDFHFYYENLNASFITIPQTWRNIVIANGLGEYSAGTMWAWPKDFVYGLFSKLGLSFSFLTIFTYILPTFIIGVWGIQKLLSYFKISKYGVWIGTIFFFCNTYLLLLIDGGQLNFAVAYALMPAAFFLHRKNIDEQSWEKRIYFALGVLAITIFDPRIAIILLALIIIDFIFGIIFVRHKFLFGYAKQFVYSGLFVMAFLLLVHSYWLLPSFLAKAPSLPVSFTRDSQLDFLNFTNIGHSLFLLSPDWFKNVFGNTTPILWEFVSIPILVFLAPVLRRKDKTIVFWLIVALVGIFLTKGSQPPLGNIYSWLFTNIPGFSFFRDSTKFFFLVALSYTVLLGITVSELIKKFSKFKNLIILMLASYLIILIYPVYAGKMTGLFSLPRYEKEYFSLAEKLRNDTDFGRIFWIPVRAPLGFSSFNHLSLEAFNFAQKRPFMIGTVGSYETLNYIREATYMGELFDIAGIKYVAYPYLDPKRDNMSAQNVDYYNTFLNQIGSLSWISKKVSDFPIPVFETKKNEDKFFLSQNTYFIVGSDSIYSDIKNLGGSFSNNALTFVEENAGLTSQIEKLPQAKVILFNKTPVDLLLSLADRKNFISPSAGLGFSPSAGSGSSRWWKREASDLVLWRDFLQQKYGIDNLDFDYGQGWAVAEGNLELKIKNEKLKSGDILYVRVMNSSGGGTVGFYQGSTKIGEVNTKIEKPQKVQIKLTGSGNVPDKYFEYDKTDFSWVRIGNLEANGEITIKTTGDINVVNSLAVISEMKQSAISQKIESLTSEGRIIDWAKLSDVARRKMFSDENKAKVSYATLSPTHYKIQVTGLNSPTTLFFSETYDTGWQLNSQGSYPLYSLINGFTVTKDGEYDLYFAPQKYVVPGLVISGITLASCIMFLLWRKLKKSFKV